MLTGFYNIEKLNTVILRRLYKDVLKKSYYICLESKYTDNNKWRGIDDKYTIDDFFKMIIYK